MLFYGSHFSPSGTWIACENSRLTSGGLKAARCEAAVFEGLHLEPFQKVPLIGKKEFIQDRAWAIDPLPLAPCSQSGGQNKRNLCFCKKNLIVLYSRLAAFPLACKGQGVYSTVVCELSHVRVAWNVKYAPHRQLSSMHRI